MVIGIGTDFIDVGRIAAAIAKPRFLERMYTQAERERIEKRGEETAAGYFAAKEAVAKALGSGFDGFTMRQIQILNDFNGKPECELTGAALQRLERIGGTRVHVSISHAGGFASAFCVIEGSGDGKDAHS